MATMLSKIFSWISYFFWAFVSLAIVFGSLYTTLGYLIVDGFSADLAFLGVFAFRYVRLLCHCIAFFCYRAAPERAKPRFTRRDVTVVIPTVSPEATDFAEAIACICSNRPHSIMIVTVGDKSSTLAERCLAFLVYKYPEINFRFLYTTEANKRAQLGVAIRQIGTPITFFVDASVFWGPNLLHSALAAFEDDEVYLVGTNKRVRVATRDNSQSIIPWGFMFNFFGSTYLARHNFEIRATNTIDGGLFAVSGRTMGIRTAFIRDPRILHGFENEKVSRVLGQFFSVFNEPLLPDDDNYITREVINAGHKIKIQYTKDARVEIADQFTYPRFLDQCKRWARTTFRSNCASLITERTVYKSQPWSVYAVYINGMINFAVGCDATLLYLFSKTTYAQWLSIYVLVAWILLAKMIKLIPHFIYSPSDLIFAPAYICFAYYHSWIKLQALITFYSAAWSGRNLKAINNAAAAPGSASG